MLSENPVVPVVAPRPSANPGLFIEKYRFMVGSSPEVVADSQVSEFIRSTANRLVQSPELMEFFYRRSSLYKQEKPISGSEVERFEQHVEAEMERLAKGCNTLNLGEEQLLGFFRLAEGHSLLTDQTRKDLGNHDRELDTHISTRAQAIIKGFFDATFDPRLTKLIENNSALSSSWFRETLYTSLRSQIKITDLMYKLATAVLSSRDDQLLEKFLTILAFETPYLEVNDPKSFFFLSGRISSDDETVAKGNRVDFLGGLLENRFPFQDGAHSLAKAGNSVINHFENSLFGEITRLLTAEDPERSYKLIKYVNLLRPFGSKIEVEIEDEDPFSIWTRPYELPENIIYNADHFMLSYFDLLSEQLLINRTIQNPIELVITDDNELRYIATPEDDNFFIAQEVMTRLLDQEQRGAIKEPLFITSIMHLLRPKINEERLKTIKERNRLLKERLQNPSRGLSEDGVVVKINNDNNSDLYFSEIYYDFSGRKITVNFNGNSFNLILDYGDFSLKYQDKEPINLDEESMLWWENVILAPLEKLVCHGDEKDWLVAGTEDLTIEQALKIKKKAITERIGHLRREPPGRSYTKEQRNKVLSLRYPLPGVEALDLKILNEQKGLTREDGQYTYVLPVAKKPTGKPIEVTVSAAFDF